MTALQVQVGSHTGEDLKDAGEAINHTDRCRSSYTKLYLLQVHMRCRHRSIQVKPHVGAFPTGVALPGVARCCPGVISPQKSAGFTCGCSVTSLLALLTADYPIFLGSLGPALDANGRQECGGERPTLSQPLPQVSPVCCPVFSV